HGHSQALRPGAGHREGKVRGPVACQNSSVNGDMDGDERRRALPELSEQWVATTDGRQLRAVVAGTGTDLVVLETGLGAAALTWGPVMEHLAPHCRVVAYDRAGYGRSDPGPGPRDLSRLADDLLAVVGAVDHSRLVLAGHSWGGPLARLAAARLMEEATGSLRDGPDARHGAARRSLTGLVLVDPADEPAPRPAMGRPAGLAPVSPWSTPPTSTPSCTSPGRCGSRGPSRGRCYRSLRCGLLRPLLHAQGAALPEPYRSCAAGDASTLTAARTMVAENAHVIRGLRSLRLDPLDLGAVPLTVVSGCLAGGGDRSVREQLIQAHSASAGAHPGGRHVRAWRSGHLVPFTEPDLVADEILALLA